MNDPRDALLAHPAWGDLAVAQRVPLVEQTQVRALPDGATLLQNLHPANDFYLLCEGSVAHLTDAPGQPGTRELATVSGQWTPVGWAGFIPPRRNTTTTVACGAITALHWSHEALARCFYADPARAARFLVLVLAGVRRQLAEVRDAWAAANGTARQPAAAAPPAESLPLPADAALDLLRRSAFFSSFGDTELARLATIACLTRHAPDQPIVAQDGGGDGIRLLAAGTAVLYAGTEGGGAPWRRPADRGLLLGGAPGDGEVGRAVFSVASGPDGCDVLTLPREALQQVRRADPEFDRALAQRTLVHLANHLGALRIRHVTREPDPELPAVAALLRHNASRLPVTSALHRLPTLLADTRTQELAFEALAQVRAGGDYTERSLAVSCEDMLHGLRAEAHFLRDTLQAYDAVVRAPQDSPPATVRDELDRRTAAAFAHLDVRLAGLEHLPESPGHVFMINHLACPETYVFPNGYHFSFDTALVSALVLQPRYGNSAIRVVRASPGAEYGHNLFYSRLGHISVYTDDSGLDPSDPEQVGKLRREAAATFFRDATEHLAAGRNLLICPEGAAQPGALSPGPFRSGVFRLAARARPEPLLVPVALANLDRRYKSHPLVALVCPPLRLSDRIDVDDPQALEAFRQAFREEYRGWIEQARAIARQEPWGASRHGAAGYQTRSSGTT